MRTIKIEQTGYYGLIEFLDKGIDMCLQEGFDYEDILMALGVKREEMLEAMALRDEAKKQAKLESRQKAKEIKANIKKALKEQAKKRKNNKKRVDDSKRSFEHNPEL